MGQFVRFTLQFFNRKRGVTKFRVGYPSRECINLRNDRSRDDVPYLLDDEMQKGSRLRRSLLVERRNKNFTITRSLARFYGS